MSGFVRDMSCNWSVRIRPSEWQLTAHNKWKSQYEPYSRKKTNENNGERKIQKPYEFALPNQYSMMKQRSHWWPIVAKKRNSTDL